MSTESSIIEGQYTPPNGTPIGFETSTITNSKLITLFKTSTEFEKVYPNGRGITLAITPESFEYFKANVLNQNVIWNNAVVPQKVSIPGTWQTNTNIVESYDGGSSRKLKRNRLSSRRKSNKRRRSRRNVNRKNKKN